MNIQGRVDDPSIEGEGEVTHVRTALPSAGGVLELEGNPPPEFGQTRLSPWGSAELSPLHAGLSSFGAPLGAELCEIERVAVAAWWTQVAERSGVSMLAFSDCERLFELRGAPAELRAAIHSAVLGKQQHVRLALALAREYQGRSGEQGVLGEQGVEGVERVAEGAREISTLARLARALVRDGCVAETVAAMEASHALTRAVEPRVCATLERMARDQRRHAELAWSCVRWLVEVEPNLLPVVQARFGAGQGASLTADAGQEPRAAPELVRNLAAHGVVAAATRAALRELALQEFARPRIAALMGSGEYPVWT